MSGLSTLMQCFLLNLLLTPAYRGKYQYSDGIKVLTLSRRIRDILATICDDKIVWKVYFLETYRRNSSHFSSSSGALANTKFGLCYFHLKVQMAKFISFPKQVRGCLYSSMVPCPSCVVAPKSQLGQSWDTYMPTHFPDRLVESIVGHVFTIFAHNSGYTQLFRA